MSERYMQVFALKENLYTEGSPVILSVGHLLKDTQTNRILAQLKIKNIGSKTIKAAKVLFHPLDTTGKPIEGDVENGYLDLSAKQGDDFGQKVAIYFPNPLTRGFTAEITQVVFSDNSLWEAENVKWEPLPEPDNIIDKFEDQELIEQFKLNYGKDSVVFPCEYKDLWVCKCETWNRSDVCSKCKSLKHNLIPLNVSELKEQCEKRLTNDKLEAEISRKKLKKIRSFSILMVAVCLIAVFIITKIIIPNNRYNQAKVLLDSGKYSQAFNDFEALNGYKDSEELAVEAYEQYKLSKLKLAEIGDYVYFGTYEQNNKSSDGEEDIEWIVLDKKENSVLLISRYVLDNKRYYTNTDDNSWEDSSLRAWLNDSFLNKAFSSREQSLIATTSVVAVDPEHEAKDTQDKIFILSQKEAEKYFSSYDNLKCGPTEYAIAQGCDDASDTDWYKYKKDGKWTCGYALRSPYSRGRLYVVSLGGDPFLSYTSYDDPIGIRPVMWVDIS